MMTNDAQYVTDPCDDCHGTGWMHERFPHPDGVSQRVVEHQDIQCPVCVGTGHWFNPRTLELYQSMSANARQRGGHCQVDPDLMDGLLLICQRVYPVE